MSPGSRIPNLPAPGSLAKSWRRTPQCQECMVKQLFRYMSGRLDTPADRPVLRQALEAFRKSGFPLQRIDGRLGKIERISQAHGGQSMSQVITKRTRLSRRIFLKGLTAAHAPVVVGVPPLVSMFNSTGTAYAAETPPAPARQAQSRSASCSGSTATAFRSATGFPRRPARTTISLLV